MQLFNRNSLFKISMRKSRKEVIFEGSERGAEQICRYSQDLPHEYQSLHTKQEASICCQELGNSNPDNKWKPPPQNYMKMNVDAAFKDEEAGFGVIIRDHRGIRTHGAGKHL